MNYQPYCLPIGDPDWLKFISIHPEANIFHHPNWIKTVSEPYGYKAFIFVLKNQANRILSGIPIVEIKRWPIKSKIMALPFTDFCQPLAVDDQYLSCLLQALYHQVKILNISKALIHHPVYSQESSFLLPGYYQHITFLGPDYNDLFRRFRKGVKSSIKKASRSDIQVETGQSIHDMKRFYCLHTETRKRLGVPVQPWQFFVHLQKNIIDQDMGVILLASKQSIPIASGIFLYQNKNIIFKYGASRQNYWNITPNNMILWHMLKWGCQNGFTSFDWGKTDISNSGLRSFKRGWSTEESVVYYSSIGSHEVEKKFSLSQTGLIKKTIQNSPLWLCRALGELFYKYAA